MILLKIETISDSLILGIMGCVLLGALYLHFSQGIKSTLQKNLKVDSNHNVQSWYLGKINWGVNDPKELDSKPFLESLGFKILGVVDSMIYVVEPPPGWQVKYFMERFSCVVDEKGDPRFWLLEKEEAFTMKRYVCQNPILDQEIIKQRQCEPVEN